MKLKNRDLRRAAHGSLLEIYKKFQPNATIDLLKKKIENLKCSFRRELRKPVKQLELAAARYINHVSGSMNSCHSWKRRR
ncbi:hypothetical protein J6590_085188 [Homalodisca vitripennis]|nr:hypothetical protein J6590_085188 [Homalodisca vitripennis]